MSFINPEAIGFRDSANMSAWGRVRVANSFNHFDNLNVYGLNARDWASLNVGGASGVHLPNEATVELRTNSTTSGAGAFRASRVSWQISMGRGFTFWAAGTYGAAVNGVRRRAGYFDSGDGVFLEQTITDLRFVLRTSVSGAPSDAIFAAQADWNIDRLDGTGPSGLTLDITMFNGLAQVVFAAGFISMVSITLHTNLSAETQLSALFGKRRTCRCVQNSKTLQQPMLLQLSN